MAKATLALPEIFGHGDFDLWLRKFEVCAVTNAWKDDDKLKRLPTLLTGKAFVVFECLSAEKKADYKVLVKALKDSFGGNDMGKYVAMMEIRNRKRKPEEDLDVYVFALESALRRAMPDVGGVLIKSIYLFLSIRFFNDCWRGLNDSLRQISS